MMIKVLAVGLAAALGLAMLPVEVSAKGLGGHASHATRHHHQHRTFGYGYYGGLGYGYYGGFGVAGQIIGGEPVDYVSTTKTLGPVIPTTFVIQCRHSEEIIVVPSEAGGTREITIRRC